MDKSSPLSWRFVERQGRGIDLDFGEDREALNETIADCVSSMAPRGDRATGLSTYWIDLLIFRLENWIDSPAYSPETAQALLAGNMSELVKMDGSLIARSLYDTADDDAVPVAAILPALYEWRELVLERGGDFEIPETYRRNPIALPDH